MQSVNSPPAKQADYICIVDKKSVGTDGGTATSGSWRIRVLNTIRSDDGSHASLNSNVITLPAGKYEFQISCSALKVNRHQCRLYNVSDSVAMEVGTSEFAYTTDNTETRSVLAGKFTITSSKNIRVEHQVEATNADDGFGKAADFGDEVYTMAEFWKVE